MCARSFINTVALARWDDALQAKPAGLEDGSRRSARVKGPTTGAARKASAPRMGARIFVNLACANWIRRLALPRKARFWHPSGMRALARRSSGGRSPLLPPNDAPATVCQPCRVGRDSKVGYGRVARSFINTVALARWKDARSDRELFQQFLSLGPKPLKRLTGSPATRHRAEATVLMGSPCGEGENWRALRCSAPPGRSEFHEPIRLAAKKRKRRKRNEDLSFSCAFCASSRLLPTFAIGSQLSFFQ